MLLMRQAARQRRVEVAFLFFPMDGEAHPHNRQCHGQQKRRQHKPRPLIAWWIFLLVVHANYCIAGLRPPQIKVEPVLSVRCPVPARLDGLTRPVFFAA